MNPIHVLPYGAALAQRYRYETEATPLLALAPRRRGRPQVARAFGSLAQRLSACADRLMPVRFAPRGHGAAQHHVH
jgi:hypothetical protein